MFKFGETAIRTVRDADGTIFGTEHVEVIEITAKFGEVIVRPFHGDDHIKVSIKDLAPVIDVEDSIDAAIHDELDRFGG